MSPTLYDVVPQCQAARTKVFNQREAPDAAASRAPLLAVLPASSAANQLPDRLVAGGDPHVPVGHLLELQQERGLLLPLVFERLPLSRRRGVRGGGRRLERLVRGVDSGPDFTEIGLASCRGRGVQYG